MFNKLVSSDAKKRGLLGGKTVTFSLLIHGLVLAGAVYASVGGPAEEERVEEEVTFMELEPEEPEQPQAEEPPPPPPPEAPVNTPPPPKGFQELVPPDVPPPVIPDIDTSAPAVKVEDFSGIGRAGGTAKGVEVGGVPTNAAPVDSSQFVFEVGSLDYDARPEIRNRGQLPGILSRYYPRMLADAGIEGQTVMQFVILPNGQVDPASIKVISSSHDQFADASVKAIEKFRFSPGKYKGQPVRVMIQIPITWKPER